MSDRLRIESVSTEDVTFLRLEGKLDKRTRPEAIAEVVSRPTVMFNLEGIQAVTKDGVARWREAMGRIDPPPKQILLTECSPPVVDKINTGTDFVGNAAVVSVQAGLHCVSCARETLVTVDMDQPVSDETLAFACAECDSPLEPDQPIDEYFAFAHTVMVSSLSEEMQAALIAFENRDATARVEPGSQEAEEFRAAAEAIAAAEAAEAARIQEDEEEAAARESEERRKQGRFFDGLKAQFKFGGGDDTRKRTPKDSAREDEAAARESEERRKQGRFFDSLKAQFKFGGGDDTRKRPPEDSAREDGALRPVPAPLTAPDAAAETSFPDATVVSERHESRPELGPGLAAKEPETPENLEEPAEPELEQPAEPELAEPAEPALEQPAEPELEAPAEPELEQPAEPDGPEGPRDLEEPAARDDDQTRLSQRTLRDREQRRGTEPSPQAASRAERRARRETEPSIRASAPRPEPESRERTSPAIRAPRPEPESRERTSPAIRAPRPAPESRERTSPAIRAPRPWAGSTLEAFRDPVVKISAGIAIGCLILVGLVFVFARPSGIPAEDIAAFLDHLEKDQLSEAEVLAEKYEEELPEPLDEHIRRAVRERRRAQAEGLIAEARKAFGAKLYNAALETAEHALELAPGHLDTLYLAAESLRLLERLSDARPYYYEFTEEAGDDDDRTDDALFWQAAALKEMGEGSQARLLCERILEMESSNFRTAATRCVEEAGE